MTKFRLPSAAAAVFFFLVGETVSKGRPPRDSQLSPSSQPPISPFARHSAGAGGPQQHIKPTPSMSQKLHPPSSMKSQLHPQQSQVPGKKGGMHPGAQQIRGDPCSTQNIKPYLKDVRSLTDAENHISQCANKICITRSTTTVVSAAVWAVFADSAYEVLKKFGAEVSQQSFNSLGNCVAYLPTSAISKMTWTEINIILTIVGNSKVELPYKTGLELYRRRAKLREVKQWGKDDAIACRPIIQHLYNSFEAFHLSRPFVEEAMKYLQHLNWDCKRPFLIVKVMLKYFPIRTWNKTIAMRFGKILCLLSCDDFKKINAPSEVFDDDMINKFFRTLDLDYCKIINTHGHERPDYSEAMKHLGGPSTIFPNSTVCCSDTPKLYTVARVIMIEVLKRNPAIDGWSDNYKRLLGNCLNGLTVREVRRVTVTKATIQALDGVILSVSLGSGPFGFSTPHFRQLIIFQKLRSQLGKESSWSREEIKSVVKQAPEEIGAKGFKRMNKTRLVELAKDKNFTKTINKMPQRTARAFLKVVLPEILKNSDFEFNKLDVSLRKRLPAQSCKKISLDNLGFPYRPDTDNATDFTEEDQQEADTSKMEIASAFVIMEKVKQKYGEVKPDSHYFNSTGTISQLNEFCSGFSKEDIGNIPSRVVKVFAGIVSKHKLTSGQGKATVNMYMKHEIKQRQEQVILPEDVYVLGKQLIHVKIEDLLKIDQTARSDAAQQISKHEDLKGFSDGYKENLAKLVMAMKGKTKGEDLTVEDVEDLGQLLEYLDEEKILRKINASVVTLSLGNLPTLTKDGPKGILADKVKKNKTGSGSIDDAVLNFNTETYSILGSIFGGFTADDIKKMDGTALRGQSWIKNAKLKPEQARECLKKINDYSQGASRRKRRSVVVDASGIDLSNASLSDITAMSDLLYGLTNSEILTINDETFKDALSYIGALSGFSSSQLESWVQVLKRAYGNLLSLGEVELKQIGYIAVGLSASDFDQLWLNDTDIVYSFGSKTNYTSSQSAAAYARVKVLFGKTLSEFNGDEIIALANFALAIPAAELLSMNTTAYEDASSNLGEILGWTDDQMLSLKTLAVRAFGPVYTWPDWQLRDVGAAIGGFTSEEFANISVEAISLIKTVALKQIPDALFGHITVEQIQELGSDQVNSISEAQQSSLSSEKLAVFNNVSQVNQTVDTSSLTQTTQAPTTTPVQSAAGDTPTAPSTSAGVKSDPSITPTSSINPSPTNVTMTAVMSTPVKCWGSPNNECTTGTDHGVGVNLEGKWYLMTLLGILTLLLVHG